MLIVWMKLESGKKTNGETDCGNDFGLREPMTVAVTGPEAMPTRIVTQPFTGSSGSMSTELAACPNNKHSEETRKTLADIQAGGPAIGKMTS